MSKNDLDKEKCLCCETPKPGSKPVKTPSTTSSSSGFKFGMPTTVAPVANDDLFKNLAAQQKKANWECSECMTSNDVNKEKCACCEAPKPGSQKASSQTSSFSFGVKSSTSDSSITPKFSFGMPASTISSSMPSLAKNVDPDFKKIVEKQKADWECSACMTRNDQSKSKCICCEQAKPGSSENKSQFSFGSKVSSSVSLPAVSEVKFSFGMQPSMSDTTIKDIKKDENNKKDEKVDEVDKPKPTFSFGAVSGSSTESAFSASTFTFKAPQTNTVSASFSMKPPNEVEDKKEEEIKEKSDTIPTDKGIDKPSMFSFGRKTETVSEKKVAFDIQPKANEEKNEKNEEKKSVGGFSFPITSTSLESSNNASKTNGGFSFGAFSKPETKEENKSSSGGFQFSASSTSSPFASTVSTTTTASVKPISTFAFGSPKPPSETIEPQKSAIFGSFGNTTPASSPFSLTSISTNPVSTSSTPVFGQNAAPSFSFGSAAAAKKDENAPVFAFGNAKTAASSGSNMVFGSSFSASTTPSVTPMFGANPAPTFGSNLSSNNNTKIFSVTTH